MPGVVLLNVGGREGKLKDEPHEVLHH